jgi:hypothetical protein
MGTAVEAVMRQLIGRVALGLVVWLAALPLVASPPSLTRLVPDDAGLCLTLQDAAAHADRFLESPLYARLREFPPLSAWRSEHAPAVRRISAEMSRQLGVEVDDVWRRAVGRQTVLAVWPPEEAGQKQGPGLLLIEAQDAELLSRLVAGLRSAQQRAGDVMDTRRATHRGLEYEERRIKRGEGTVHVYLAVLDRIGVLASHEHLLHRVLELHATRDVAGPRLAQLPAYLAALEQVDAAAPARLFVNPRAWDAALARSLPADESRKPGQLLLAQFWRSLHYGVFAFSLHPQARADGFLAVDERGDANELSEVLGALSGPAVMLDRIPSESLAAAAGTVDVTRLLRWARGMDRDGPPSRRSLPEIVWSLIDGTFQGIGPGFGGFLAAPPEGSEFPIAAAAGMQIQGRAPAQPDGMLKPAEALRSVLQAALALSPPREGHAPQLKSRTLGETEILTVVDLAEAPPGLAPSFAFTDGTLFVGTIPGVVEQAAAATPVSPLAAKPVFRRLLTPRLQAPTHAAYANLAALRRWLAAEGDRLAAMLSQGKDSADDARHGLEQLGMLLKLADHAAAAAQFEPTGIRVTAAAMVDE